VKVVEYLHTAEGGHLVYTKELAGGLRAAGVDVEVLLGRGAVPEEGLSPLVPTPDTTLSVGPRWLLDRLSVYARQSSVVLSLLEERYDPASTNWLHCQQLPTLGAKSFVRRARGAGWMVCITVHNVSPHATDRLTRALHDLHVKAWAEADLLLVHSDGLRRQLVTLLGDSTRPRVEVVPHPVWTEQRPVEQSPTRDFLFFGHLRPNKGVELFLAALAEAGDPTATIAGAGSPERVQAIRDQIRSLGLSNLDFRPGFVDDAEVPLLFADHHVVVTPYVGFEAQSGVTHLAVAFDRPIVVTDVGALRDLVDEFGLGVVAENGATLAASMLEARAGAVEGRFLSGLVSARERLSPASVGQRLAQVLGAAHRG